ncbi:MAG: hypothetical protein MUP14_05420 [Dehalococcoidia bacterium]|nr:hypothetical protein [Dehalococcoidia bacterium]
MAGFVSIPLAFVIALVIVHRWYEREKESIRQELLDALRQALTSPEKDVPSPVAILADQLATLFAQRTIQAVKATLGGVEKEVARGEQLAMFEEAAGSSPWLGLIAGMIPKKLRNQLMRNPQMVGALAKLAGGTNHSDKGAEVTPPRRHRE